MKHILIVTLLFLRCVNISSAQAEHYAGLAVSNVVGPSYTLRHNRLAAVADAGWLAGFSGAYASVGGMYELLSINSLQKLLRLENKQSNAGDMLVSMGLGVFAQDYHSPSARQRRRADNLGYVAPFGLNVLVEFRWRTEALPSWNVALRIRGPVYFTAKEYEDVFSKGAGAMMLATCQLVVQRRF
jgi:hypothetical protein